MDGGAESGLVCSECGADLLPADEFCGRCGCILADVPVCHAHPSRRAIGRCVVCGSVFCSLCGAAKFGFFLCDEHWRYETVEGMARVFGALDNVQVHFVRSCLEQSGLHPFVYSRHANPGPGMLGTVPMLAVRTYGRYAIAEIKVLVPFSEVLQAEAVLNELSLTS